MTTLTEPLRSKPAPSMDGKPGLLKRYVVSVACFLLVGGFLLHLYTALYSNATNTWTVDGWSWPLVTLVVVLGFFTYFPFFLPTALPVVAIAAALYCALALTFARRTLRADVGAACGALAAVATAAAHLTPELLYTTGEWAQKWGIGAAIGGTAAGASAAFILRRSRSAPRFGVAGKPGAHDVVAAVAAWGFALVGMGVAINDGRARTDDVLLQRDGAVAANAFRASSVAERASAVGGMLASATHRSTIAEKVPGSDYPQSRELPDHAAIAHELARLQERLGPPLSTRSIASLESGGLTMHYVDQHPREQASETMVFRRKNGVLQLETYNLSLQGRRDELLYASLLVNR
jgi:hypothetical protein